MKNELILLVLPLLVISCAPSPKAPETTAGSGANKNAAVYTVGAVEGFVVKATPLSESVLASGSILPAENTELHPEASGRVLSINLPEGKIVRKGALLLKIFDEDLRTQMRKLETQLKQAEITEQRLAELLKVKGVSQQEYDLAVLSVQNLRNEMDIVRINIGKTELRAPFDGILGLRNISPGAYVTPATAVATIHSSSGLKLDFSVPERYASSIRIGQQVHFTVEGHTNNYTAVVQATDQVISEASRDLLVRAVIREGARDLLPGAFASVALTLGQKSEAILIPSQAVIPQARDKKVFISRNGKAQSVTIKTGIRQASMVEVTSGLQIGDTIATTGMLFLKPDALLRFSKVE